MRIAIVLVLALAAVAGVVLLAGGDPLGLLTGGARGGAGGEGAGLEAAGAGEGEATGAAALGARRGPRLFGSERAQRAGKGALRGRVLDVRTAKGVPQAALLLTGTGYAKEPVAVRSTTAADGTFQLLDVPAGDGLALRIEAPGPLSRGVTGVEVAAEDVTDLGDLYLGQPGIVEGVVLDPAGEPVVGADVALHRGASSLREFLAGGGFIDFLTNIDRQPEPVMAQASRARGAFRFENVSPGPFTLLVRAPGFRQAALPVTLAGEQAHEQVTVRLSLGGQLSGRVVDSEGRGVSGAHVVAFSAEGGMPSPLARTFGDCEPDGTFRLTTLSGEGKQLLIAGAEGWPNAFAEARSGSNDVRIVLLRGATLELRFVTDDGGEPLEGAQVLAAVGETRQMGGGAPGGLVGGLTDRAGVVTLDVRPGELQFLVLSGPGAPTTMWAAAQKMPGGMKGPESTTIRPGANRMAFRVPRGAQVKGRVLSDAGAPLAGAEVVSLGFMGDGGRTVSAADGSFELFVMRDLSMGLVAKLPGWVQDKAERPPRPAAGGDGVVEMTLRMRAATSVTGRVVTADGKPVGGAQVRVRREGEGGGFNMEAMLATLPEGLTLADGTYLLDGVPSGAKLRVLAQRQGFVDGGSAPFDVPAQGVGRAPEVVLRDGAHVRVRVDDSEGRPLKGARVRAEVQRDDGVDDAFERMLEQQAGVHDHRTGADGSVEIRLLPPGALSLRFTAEGHAPQVRRVKIAADAVGLPDVAVRLAPGFVIQGRVLDAEGRPVRGATVHARNAPDAAPAAREGAAAEEADAMGEALSEWDGSRFARTDADGSFRLADLLPRGYRLHVSADGLRSAVRPVDVASPTVEVRLAPLDPAVERRIEALEAERRDIYESFASSTPAEQAQLSQRLEAIRQELERLQGAAEGSD